MKLYVWEDVLENYSSGIMFALANSLIEAKSLIREQYKACFGSDARCADELVSHPHQEFDTPVGFFMCGGS